MRSLVAHALLLAALALLAAPAGAEILLQEDFEDDQLEARGWFDIAKWGEEKSLSIAGAPEVQAKTGQKCLKIAYALNANAGWMHHAYKGVNEVYCRYYRLFPEGWEWPKSYGPHDTLLIAGTYVVPTNTDVAIYMDFWRTDDTIVRATTGHQKWYYNGYPDQVLRKYGGVHGQLAQNVSRADKVERGKWHCVEYYCRLSGAGQEDGCLRQWVNGKLVGELDGIPIVDERHAGILFDRFMLGPNFHGGSHKVQWNYMDSLVVSTQYIGTVEQKGNQPPRARFSTTRDWGSMTASFDASRSADPDGTIATYTWEFGDGKSGQGKTATHTYAAPGDYTVRLTVTDGKGETHAVERAISVGPEVGNGIGIKAEYYDGEEFGGKPVVRVERRIDFEGSNWNTRYLRGGVGNYDGKDYSCRWTGFVQPTRSEEYTLTLDAVDGGRLWFDGKLIVDTWVKPGATAVPVGKLEAGRKYAVRVEQHHGPDKNKWLFRARLLWESTSTKKEVVPTTQLYLPEGLVEP